MIVRYKILKQDRFLGQTARVGHLFELTFLYLPPSLHTHQVISTAITSSSLYLLHLCLSHASLSKLHRLLSSDLLGSINNESFDCLHYQLAKQSALSFDKSDSICPTSFDLIYSDI